MGKLLRIYDKTYIPKWSHKKMTEKNKKFLLLSVGMSIYLLQIPAQS